MKQVRYGMVGGAMEAFIGEVHRKALAFDPRAVLAAGAFSSNPARNQNTAAVYGLDPGRVYADYREMARAEGMREDGIDFVVIVTPNHLHHDAAKAFLEAGIHVMCEKPLTTTVAEAEELAALAREKGLLFGVTYTYTGYAMAKVMRDMIAQGAIGRIIAVNAEYAQEWLLDEIFPEEKGEAPAIWRLAPAKTGISSCVGDIGTHVENFIHYVTGLKIKRLIATTDRFGQQLDLNANVLVQYEGGVSGAYWASQVAAGHQNGLVARVFGEEGSLEWAQESPDVLRYAKKGQPVQLLGRGNSYLTGKGAAFNRVPSGHPEGLYVAFANLYKEFVSAVMARRAGEETLGFDFPRVEAGLEGVRFVHAVADSAQRGAWVDLIT